MLAAFSSCNSSKRITSVKTVDLYDIDPVKINKKIPAVEIKVKGVQAEEFVAYAKSFIGVKYRYGSTDVEKGLDCSGFLWNVFHHFDIKVPRTSEGYTNSGREVKLRDARKGDLILFTGSDAASGVVGHIGIIIEHQNRQITFIHSSSGNNKGVIISEMSEYYRKRFVKVNRVFD